MVFVEVVVRLHQGTGGPRRCQLCRQLFGLLSWVAGGQDLEAEVARCGWRAGRLVLGNFAEGHVGEDLSPSCCRHLGNRSQAVGNIVVVFGTVRPVLATRRAPVKRVEIHPQPLKDQAELTDG